MTITPTIAASATECQKTKRKMEPSLPTWLVAAVAIQMDCASTILPMTPPALFAAHIRMGLRLSCWAVIFCKPPKRALEEVSLPEKGKRSEEHTSELQSRLHLVCRLLLEKKKHTH